MDLNDVRSVRMDLDSQMKELSSCKSRIHKCGTCDKLFQSNQQLIQHSLVHTNKRSYTCSYCNKTFKQKCHVVQHERIHTGERPYKCPNIHCLRSFRQQSSLNQHINGCCKANSIQKNLPTKGKKAKRRTVSTVNNDLKVLNIRNVSANDIPDFRPMSTGNHSVGGTSSSTTPNYLSSTPPVSSYATSSSCNDSEAINENISDVIPCHLRSLIDLKNKLDMMVERQCQLEKMLSSSSGDLTVGCRFQLAKPPSID